MYKILIVEDDLLYAKDLSKTLQKYGCEILPIVETVSDAITVFCANNPTLVLIDIELKGKENGIEFAKYIKKNSRIPFIFLSQYFGKEGNLYFKSANDTKPYNYLPKGSMMEKQLWHFIEVAIDNFAAENSWLIEGVEHSYVIRDVLYLKNGTNDYKLIHLNTITYIEVGIKYCVLRTEAGSIYNIRKSLTQVALLLQSTPYLIQVSQHYIINANKAIRFSKSDSYVWISAMTNPIEVGRLYANKLFSLLPHTI